MNRRTLLGTVASLTAGCLDSPPGVGTRPPDEPGVTTGTPTPDTDAGPVPDGGFRLSGLDVTTTTDRPEARFVLKPIAFYSADGVERERESADEPVVVMDVSDVEDGAVRRAVEVAIEDGPWRADALPDGLADVVDRVDFFTGVPGSGVHTHVGLALYRTNSDDPPALSFDASVLDATVSNGAPGAVEFALTNEGAETREVFSGTVPPFGLVRAEAVDSAGQFLLWRDYDDEGCVGFTDDGLVVCSIGVITPIEPGERIARRYEVLPPSTSNHPAFTVPPSLGRYRVAQELGYSPGHGAPGSTLSFQLDFDLESA